ncbi:chromosome replication initiation inhibitor protein [Klebsiella quasipneumoniae]|nr:chromosome replication initiation inhibitor protein [Klebsiella quasipneumoniae]
MRDDLNAIPVFVTVVESGNFASAATILHVTRSAVGKTIARLRRVSAWRYSSAPPAGNC